MAVPLVYVKPPITLFLILTIPVLEQKIPTTPLPLVVIAVEFAATKLSTAELLPIRFGVISPTFTLPEPMMMIPPNNGLPGEATAVVETILILLTVFPCILEVLKVPPLIFKALKRYDAAVPLIVHVPEHCGPLPPK